MVEMARKCSFSYFRQNLFSLGQKLFPFVKSLASRKSKIAHQFSESFFVLPAEGRKQPTGQVEVESCAGWGWGVGGGGV